MILPPPPGDGRRRPFIVRYVLGNVRTRTAAKRLTLVMAAFVVIAIVLNDAILIAVAVIGVAAYLLSIRWMDTHNGWAPPDDPPG